jgi:uncharacterized YigZ family protein
VVTGYRTIARDAEAEIEAKRSRFRCTLRRVADEAAARAVVDDVRRRHWDARHHCLAMVLGPEGQLHRSSDDGEPAGTAGAPMLEVLRGAGVSDVVAVVTRWFGGTLLGAGGLVRAYSEAVSAALELAGTRERVLVHDYAVGLPHSDAGRVEAALRDRGVLVLDRSFGDRVTLTLGMTDPDPLAGWLAELLHEQVSPVPRGTRWVDLE